MRFLVALLAGAFVVACGDSTHVGDTSTTTSAGGGDGEGGEGGSPDGGMGGQGGADLPPTCGDGRVDPAEQCDDGNVEDDDGCSALCLDEVCGDGIINGIEACDDGDLAEGDGCDVDCLIEDSWVCSGEPSDCVREGECGAPWVLDLTGGETTVTGDTSTATSSVPSAICGSFDRGDAGDRVYEIDIDEASDVVVILTPDFESGLLRLLESPCEPSSGVSGLSGDDGCGEPDEGTASLLYANLAPGTYYVVVDGEDMADVGPYELTIRVSPTLCGNGAADGKEGCDDGGTVAGDGCDASCVTEPLWDCEGEPSECFYACGNGLGDGQREDCDDGNQLDGDGCSSLCAREPGYLCSGEPSVCVVACGDGIVHYGLGEECDDGNVADGDRCSAACLLESTEVEREPNDTMATAMLVSDGFIRGSSENLDVDLYTFTLSRPALVDLELYTTIDRNPSNYNGYGTLAPLVDCCSCGGRSLYLFDESGDVADNSTALAFDLDDGAGWCGYLGPSRDPEMFMQPGTYYVKVQSPNLTVYVLDVKIAAAAEPTVDGIIINEVLANDSTLDANCDGVTTQTQDEFVELVNATSEFVDLTGVTISDEANGIKHTFPPLGLRAGQATVVFSGGTPMCPSFAGVPVFVSQSILSLNNDNGGITVRDASTNVLATASWPSSPPGLSTNLSTDGTDSLVGPPCGSFVNHDTLATGVPASPGTRADGTPF